MHFGESIVTKKRQGLELKRGRRWMTVDLESEKTAKDRRGEHALRRLFDDRIFVNLRQG